MADEYEKVDFPIKQPIKGLEMIRIVEADIVFKKPDRIKRDSANKVSAYYGNYVQVITADGAGNERHNFKSEIKEIT